MGNQELLVQSTVYLYLYQLTCNEDWHFNALDKKLYFNVDHSCVITPDASNRELKHECFHQEYHQLDPF